METFTLASSYINHNTPPHHHFTPYHQPHHQQPHHQPYAAPYSPLHTSHYGTYQPASSPDYQHPPPPPQYHPTVFYFADSDNEDEFWWPQQPMRYFGYSPALPASAPLAAAVPPAPLKPLELMTPIERADASTVWKEFSNWNGEKYYYNEVTKQYTWTIPEELRLAREQAAEEMNTKETEVTKEAEVLKEKSTGELRPQKDELLMEFAVVEEKKNVPSLSEVQENGKAIHRMNPPPQPHRVVEDDDVSVAVEFEMKEELKQKFEGLPFQLSGIVTENFKVENEVGEDDQTVNPWIVSAKEGGKIDYDKLIDKSECQRLNQDLIDRTQRVPGRTTNVFRGRGVFFAHKDFNEIWNAYENKEGVYSEFRIQDGKRE